MTNNTCFQSDRGLAPFEDVRAEAMRLFETSHGRMWKMLSYRCTDDFAQMLCSKIERINIGSTLSFFVV